MKIKITRSTGINGTVARPGTVVEAPNTLAVDLIKRDRAVLAGEEDEPEVTTEDGPKPFLEDEGEGAGEPAGEEPEGEPAAPTKRGSRKS